MKNNSIRGMNLGLQNFSFRSNSSEENLILGTLARVDLLGVGVGVGASIGGGVGSVDVVSGGGTAGVDTGVELGVI